MIRKIILSGILAAVMFFPLCACGNTNTENNSSTESTAVSEISQSESSITESSLTESSSTQSSKTSDIAPVPNESSVVSIPDADTAAINDLEDKYFVKKLSSDNLYYFAELYKAASKHKEKVKFIAPISDDDLTTLMFLLNYDCPELIHLSGDYYPEYTDDSMRYISGLRFTYCMSDDEYKNASAELEAFFKELEQKLEGRTDTEKEKYVYDLIFDNCIYNEQEMISGSAYGVFIKHTGRCEGLSKAFMWAMHRLSVECLCISGQQLWSTTALYSEHSWNMIKLDGDWYNLDITVDNVKTPGVTGNPPNYGFYNVTDEFISKSREINYVYTSLGKPDCNSDKLNYHTVNGLLLQDGQGGENEVRSLLSQHLTESGIDNLSIKFESDDDYALAKESIEQWTGEILRQASEESFKYNTYYNSLSKTIVIYAYKES